MDPASGRGDHPKRYDGDTDTFFGTREQARTLRATVKRGFPGGRAPRGGVVTYQPLLLGLLAITIVLSLEIALLPNSELSSLVPFIAIVMVYGAALLAALNIERERSQSEAIRRGIFLWAGPAPTWAGSRSANYQKFGTITAIALVGFLGLVSAVFTVVNITEIAGLFLRSDDSSAQSLGAAYSEMLLTLGPFYGIVLSIVLYCYWLRTQAGIRSKGFVAVGSIGVLSPAGWYPWRSTSCRLCAAELAGSEQVPIMKLCFDIRNLAKFGSKIETEPAPDSTSEFTEIVELRFSSVHYKDARAVVQWLRGGLQDANIYGYRTGAIRTATTDSSA